MRFEFKARQAALAVLIGAALTAVGYTGITGSVSGQGPAKGREDTSEKVQQGRELVGQVCTQCHSLGPILMQKRSSEEWKNTVYSMISRGAQVLPDEIEPVAAYLASSFGPDSKSFGGGSRGSGAEVPAAGAAPETLPDGAGRAVLSGVCVKCHDLAPVLGTRKSDAEWGQVVDRMKSFGASLTAGEQRQLLEYLAKNFGSVR